VLAAFVAVGLGVGWYRCHASHLVEEAKGARRLASVEAELAATQNDLEETAGKLTRCEAWLDARLLAAQAADAPRAPSTPQPQQVLPSAPDPAAASAGSLDPSVAVHETMARVDAGARGQRRHRVLQVHGAEPDDSREQNARE
jgi:hypothetical protein